jgi:hypothetical protein
MRSATVVVVIQDGSVPDARSVVAPAVLALEAGLEGAGIWVRIAETRGSDERSAAEAASAAGDPSVLAVVVAPFASLPPAARDDLLAAGVAVVSLSDLDAPPAGEGLAWRRMVPGVTAEAQALASLLPGPIPCVAGEGWAASLALTDALGAVGASVFEGEPASAGEGAVRAGCAGIAWTGSAGGAARLRDTLGTQAGGEPPSIVLGPAARTDGFVENRWPAAVGTFGICGCADLNVSAEPADQAFVHTYQLATGLDPGPYAAEGADAASLILWAAGIEPPFERARVTAWLAATVTFDGLNAYRWDNHGDPIEPGVRTFVVEGVRWLPVSPVVPS